MKILVLGGGLFGSSIAFTLADKNNTIDLVESEGDIMKMASYVNHNRIHLGYHYLRSIKTAEQSTEGLLSFLSYFGNAVQHQFPNYYAIAKDNSKTSANQFISFCDKVGIGYSEEFPEYQYLNRESVEACFRVPEPIWDFNILKDVVKENLAKNNVNVFLNTTCEGLSLQADGTFKATFNTGVKFYDIVINATYSYINEINNFLGIKSKELLFEDVFIPVFKYSVPPIGLTVMDGPFCSIMPRGIQENEFLLYHVKESVIDSKLSFLKPEFKKESNTINNITGKDGIYDKSSYYYPFLKSAEHIGFNRTVRTVYENSDDARISEIYTYDGVENYYTVLSGKVTTCIKLALDIKHLLQNRKQ